MTTVNDRQTCTAEAPRPKDAKGRWQHPDADEVYADYSMYGSYATFVCPHCGLRFKEELAD